MPKAIKRRMAGDDVKAEERVKDYLTETVEWAENNLRTIAIAAVAALVGIGVVFGLFSMRGSSKEKALELFADGYEQFYGFYENSALVEVERNNKALESFTQSYEKQATPLALLYMANTNYELGRYDEARQRLDQLLAKFPDDDMYVPLALYKLAMVELKAGNPEEAVRRLDELSSGRSASFRDLALAEAARTLEGLGRTEEAMTKYETIVREYPGSPFYEEAKERTGQGESESGSTLELRPAEEPKQ